MNLSYGPLFHSTRILDTSKYSACGTRTNDWVTLLE